MLHEPSLVKVQSIPSSDADIEGIVGNISSQFDEKTSISAKRENMRGIVTSRIIWVYAICICAIIFSGIIAILFGNPQFLPESIQALKTLVEFLHVLVLPIITLVLGFYYGSEKQ